MDENKFVNYMTLISGGILGLLFLIPYINPDYGSSTVEQALGYILLLPILMIFGFLFFTGLISIILRPIIRYLERRSIRRREE